MIINMKNNADKKRCEMTFQVGAMVYLRLRPFCQITLSKSFCQKLATKFYGPFKVLEKIGQVAY